MTVHHGWTACEDRLAAIHPLRVEGPRIARDGTVWVDIGVSDSPVQRFTASTIRDLILLVESTLLEPKGKL